MLWSCSQNADVWYHNLDKLIHYINMNASMGGPVVAFCESAKTPPFLPPLLATVARRRF